MIRKVENSHELIADVQTGETRTGAKLTFGSVCSGIEGASVALSPLGWECRWFYEVDPFCCSVLRFHYSKVTNYGDASQDLQPEPVDLVVGGTPCQSFSVTGNRNGLNDPRGQLALAFPAIAERAKARWIIWENVVGVHFNRPETFRMDDYVVKTGTGQYGSIVLHVFDAGGEEVAWADTGVMPDTSKED